MVGPGRAAHLAEVRTTTLLVRPAHHHLHQLGRLSEPARLRPDPPTETAHSSGGHRGEALREQPAVERGSMTVVTARRYPRHHHHRAHTAGLACLHRRAVAAGARPPVTSSSDIISDVIRAPVTSLVMDDVSGDW